MNSVEGWVLSSQIKLLKHLSSKLNWASKLQMWWPKQWSVQGSDPQRSAEQATVNMVTRAHMQAHGKANQNKNKQKASPCGHPTDHRARWSIGLRWTFNSFIVAKKISFDLFNFTQYHFGSVGYSWILSDFNALLYLLCFPFSVSNSSNIWSWTGRPVSTFWYTSTYGHDEMHPSSREKRSQFA